MSNVKYFNVLLANETDVFYHKNEHLAKRLGPGKCKSTTRFGVHKAKLVNHYSGVIRICGNVVYVF